MLSLPLEPNHYVIAADQKRASAPASRRALCATARGLLSDGSLRVPAEQWEDCR